MKLIANNKIYSEYQFDKEMDFEKEIVIHSKLFFGNNSIYIDAKRKIETKTLGNSIPDGFLFDLSDKNNPEFYLVEVELEKHSFYSHMFPQITKFIGFYKNTKIRHDLIEKLFFIVDNDNELKREFKKQIGEKEIYKFLKDTIEQSQNILLVIDGEKREMPEIVETYSESWGKMVKLVVIKKFFQGDDFIYTMNPEFEILEFTDIEEETKVSRENVVYTEEYHLEDVSDTTKHIYQHIKSELLKENPNLKFNPQKYYISIRNSKNIAFFLIKHKRVSVVVLNPEEDTRKQIHHHYIKTLTPGVQRFWNGPSCKILIETTEHLDEVIALLNKLVSKCPPALDVEEETLP